MVKDTFTLKDSYPWLGILVLLDAILILVFAYAKPSFFQAYGLIAVFLAFVGLAARHYWDRYKQAKEWEAAPKCLLDIPVFGDVSLDYLTMFDQVIIDAVIFWQGKLRYTQPASCLEGATITVVPSPFYVSGVLCGEVVEGKDIKLVGLPAATTEKTTSYLRHAVGHIVLSALGVAPGPLGEEHHKLFKELGYVA